MKRSAWPSDELPTPFEERPARATARDWDEWERVGVEVERLDRTTMRIICPSVGVALSIKEKLGLRDWWRFHYQNPKIRKVVISVGEFAELRAAARQAATEAASRVAEMGLALLKETERVAGAAAVPAMVETMPLQEATRLLSDARSGAKSRESGHRGGRPRNARSRTWTTSVALRVMAGEKKSDVIRSIAASAQVTVDCVRKAVQRNLRP